MVIALLIFSGSCGYKAEVNHLRTTEKKMQHDSAKIPEFGSIRGKASVLDYNRPDEIDQRMLVLKICFLDKYK
jgi:hypothetical protein